MTPAIDPAATCGTGPAAWELLHPLLSQCCIDLFSRHGLDLERADWAPAEHTVAAVIGFAGEQVRGNLMLTTTPAFLEQAPPTLIARWTHPQQCAAWLGELSNQLLGLVKGRLLDYQVSLELCIPRYFSGGRIESAAPPGRAIELRAGPDCLHLFFDAVLRPGVTLRYTPLPPAERPIPAGEWVEL